MKSRPIEAHAFTIVEMLVVIAIIGILMGVLLPALSGVQRRGRKATENHNIRQVYLAWQMYSNQNNDAALPGFLEQGVQEQPNGDVSRGWSVKYQYPNRTHIPINTDNIAGPWTWRLFSYLDYNDEMMTAHLNDPGYTMYQLDPDLPQSGAQVVIPAEAIRIAYEPAFAYNGYYIGAYWRMQGSGPSRPVHDYNNDCDASPPNPAYPVALMIPTTVPQIRRATETVVFCSATQFATTGLKIKQPSHLPGVHLVSPRNLGNVPQWQPDPGDAQESLEVLAANARVPFARHTGKVSVVYADGRVESQAYNALDDQRSWIQSADKKSYMHVPCP